MERIVKWDNEIRNEDVKLIWYVKKLDVLKIVLFLLVIWKDMELFILEVEMEEVIINVLIEVI